ncbi:hypothetical protein GGI12_002099 [Dipsacomyces acuminosporus]|nr:hypothetical protein GGI12_002099 [Dipsacomyces acuminosporus]
MKLFLIYALNLACSASAMIIPRNTTGTVDSVDRIIGGTATKEGEHPYIVSVEMLLSGSKGLCGGTLIGDRMVVTAGHCMYDSQSSGALEPQNVIVGLGSNNRNRQTRIRAQAVHLHPQFDPVNIANDIAIIILEQSSSGRSNTATISVYSGSLPERTRLTALGWGQTKTTPGVVSVSSVLMRTDIIVGMQGECQQYLSSYVSSDGPQICTQNRLLPGDDTCQGDSGTGVVISSGGRYYLAGLTSYGSNLAGDPTCALNDGFAIYTHIYYHMGFINSVSRELAQ